MGLSTEQLIEIGLNFAGFLTAGILTFYVYAIMAERRHRRAALSGSGEAIQPEAELNSAKRPEPAVKQTRAESKAQFIRLTDNLPVEKPEEKIAGSQSEYRIRDRQEILNQARQMLAEKKRGTTVQKVLPITERELSFLKQSQRLQGKARMR